MITDERFEELLDGFRTRRIAVLGDFFLDKYLDVDPALAEVSVETGMTAHQVVGVRCSPGAAGTVVNNLVALEAGTVHPLGAIGADGEGFALRHELTRRGCAIEGLLVAPDLLTPTYLKPRDVTNPGLSGEHSRYDTKNRARTSGEVERAVVAALDRLLPELDAIVIADQVEADGCGIVTRDVRAALADRAAQHPRVVFWADSRRRIREFRRVIVKPNQFEAIGRENPGPDEEVRLHELARGVEELRAATGAPVVATRGAQGALVSDPELTLIPGVRVDGPIDTTGAGDSVTAGAVLALATGATLAEAALVGMLVASITIQQLATTGVATREQVRHRLTVWRDQQR